LRGKGKKKKRGERVRDTRLALLTSTGKGSGGKGPGAEVVILWGQQSGACPGKVRMVATRHSRLCEGSKESRTR